MVEGGGVGGKLRLAKFMGLRSSSFQLTQRGVERFMAAAIGNRRSTAGAGVRDVRAVHGRLTRHAGDRSLQSAETGATCVVMSLDPGLDDAGQNFPPHMT